MSSRLKICLILSLVSLSKPISKEEKYINDHLGRFFKEKNQRYQKDRFNTIDSSIVLNGLGCGMRNEGNEVLEGGGMRRSPQDI